MCWQRCKYAALAAAVVMATTIGVRRSPLPRRRRRRHRCRRRHHCRRAPRTEREKLSTYYFVFNAVVDCVTSRQAAVTDDVRTWSVPRSLQPTVTWRSPPPIANAVWWRPTAVGEWRPFWARTPSVVLVCVSRYSSRLACEQGLWNNPIRRRDYSPFSIMSNKRYVLVTITIMKLKNAHFVS